MLEEIFDDLLRFVFPDADQIFDLTKGFEFLDKELAELYPEPEKSSDTRFVDKLVKVYQPGGENEFVPVHVEVQGQFDKHFAERMFEYYYRIRDHYKQPPITIAIFTGADAKQLPDRFEEHFQGTHLVYQYNTLSLVNYTDEELMKSDNPFAMVILAAKTALLKGKIPELELKDRKLLIARQLIGKKIFSKRKVEKILVFLNNYILFDKKETTRIFTKQLDLITAKKATMGIVEQLAEIKQQEARMEGRGMANRLFIKNLLKDSDFTLEKIASLTGVSIDYVKHVKKNIRSK